MQNNKGKEEATNFASERSSFAKWLFPLLFPNYNSLEAKYVAADYYYEKGENEMKTTSRLEFLKGTLAGAASLTLAGVLSACGADSKPTPAADLTPTAGKGTYIPGDRKSTRLNSSHMA